MEMEVGDDVFVVDGGLTPKMKKRFVLLPREERYGKKSQSEKIRKRHSGSTNQNSFRDGGDGGVTRNFIPAIPSVCVYGPL
jgi:hypothetical protein